MRPTKKRQNAWIEQNVQSKRTLNFVFVCFAFFGDGFVIFFFFLEIMIFDIES